MDPHELTPPPDGGESEATNGALGLPIGEVSRTVGISPQTLRAWEREGLIAPSRSKKGTRYYSQKNLERLREVKRLRTVHGLNFAAIRREMGPVQRNPVPVDTSGERLPRSVGNRLRRMRMRQGKTLKEMAKATGLSASFLSSLERGHTGASIASLRSVMGAYGTDWREAFRVEESNRSRLVGPDDRPAMQWPNGVRFEDLSTSGALMDPTFMYLPPHAGSGESMTHTGEEFVYVLSGVLFVELEENPPQTYRLESKDCLYFPSTVPHSWWTEEDAAEIIYVNSPPSF
jgi:DNA-binding transcriptional MerR regulator/mannose-6-phosphate isomerase-like protein (cupin superfamily)